MSENEGIPDFIPLEDDPEDLSALFAQYGLANTPVPPPATPLVLPKAVPMDTPVAPPAPPTQGFDWKADTIDAAALGHYNTKKQGALNDLAIVMREASMDDAGQIMDTYEPVSGVTGGSGLGYGALAQPLKVDRTLRAARRANKLAEIKQTLAEAEAGIAANTRPGQAGPNMVNQIFQGAEPMAYAMAPQVAAWGAGLLGAVPTSGTSLLLPIGAAVASGGIMGKHGYDATAAQALIQYGVEKGIDITTPQGMQVAMSDPDFVAFRDRLALKVGAISATAGTALGLLPGASQAATKNLVGEALINRGLTGVTNAGTRNLISGAAGQAAGLTSAVGIGSGQSVATNYVSGNPLGKDVAKGALQFGVQDALLRLLHAPFQRGPMSLAQAVDKLPDNATFFEGPAWKSVTDYARKAGMPEGLTPTQQREWIKANVENVRAANAQDVTPEPAQPAGPERQVVVPGEPQSQAQAPRPAPVPPAPQSVADVVVPPAAPTAQDDTGRVLPYPRFGTTEQKIEWFKKYNNTHDFDGTPKVTQPSQPAPAASSEPPDFIPLEDGTALSARDEAPTAGQVTDEMIIRGAYKMPKFAGDYEAWANDMITDFGPGIEASLPDIFDRGLPLRQKMDDYSAKMSGSVDKAGNLRRRDTYRDQTGLPVNPLVQFADEQGKPYFIGGLGKNRGVDDGKPTEAFIKEVEAFVPPEKMKEFFQWYERVAPQFIQTFGSLEKPENGIRMMTAWLAAQQNEGPAGALRNVFRKEDQLAGFKGFSNKDGEVKETLKAGLADSKVGSILQDQVPEGGFGAKLTDFSFGSGTGRVTREYMGHDASAGAPFVADVWTGRDYGFLDSQTLNRLIEKANEGKLTLAGLNGKDGGGKPVKITPSLVTVRRIEKVGAGKPKDNVVASDVTPEEAKDFIAKIEAEKNPKVTAKIVVQQVNVRSGRKSVTLDADLAGSPADAQYERAADWGNRVTSDLNKMGYQGRKWVPSEVQALGWMAKMKQYGEAEATGSDAFRENTSRISQTLDFSEGGLIASNHPEVASLPPEARAQVTKDVVETSARELAQIIGGSLRIVGTTQGQAITAEGMAPSVVIQALGSPESKGMLASALALVGKQASVTTVEFGPGGANSRTVHFSKPDGSGFTAEEKSALGALIGPGLSFHEFDGVERALITRSNGKSLTEAMAEKALAKLGQWANDAGVDLEADHTPTSINHAENNWQSDQEGRPYQEAIVARGGSSRLQSILDYRQRYEAVVREAVGRARGGSEEVAQSARDVAPEPDSARDEVDRKAAELDRRIEARRQAQERDTNPETARRGNEQIAQRLVNELRRGGNLTQQEVSAALRVVEKLMEHGYLDNLKVSVSVANPGEAVRGGYTAATELVQLFVRNTNRPGVFRHTFAHEVAHHLERMIPAKDLEAARQQFLRERAAWFKDKQGYRKLLGEGNWLDKSWTHQEIVDFAAKNDIDMSNFSKHFIRDTRTGRWRIKRTDETYRLTNFSEYFADKVADTASARDNARPNPQDQIGVWARMKSFFAGIKKALMDVFGRDKVEKIWDKFQRGEYTADFKRDNLHGYDRARNTSPVADDVTTADYRGRRIGPADQDRQTRVENIEKLEPNKPIPRAQSSREGESYHAGLVRKQRAQLKQLESELDAKHAAVREAEGSGRGYDLMRLREARQDLDTHYSKMDTLRRNIEENETFARAAEGSVESARDDGENTPIPGGYREAFFKARQGAGAPEPKQIKFWTDVGHNDEGDTFNQFLWAINRQGEMKIISSADLNNQMVDRGMDVGIDGEGGVSHLDWSDTSGDEWLLSGPAHGRIDATGDVVRISMVQKNKGDTAMKAEMQNYVKGKLAEAMGIEPGQARGYDFTDAGPFTGPEVFSARDEEGPSIPKPSRAGSFKAFDEMVTGREIPKPEGMPYPYHLKRFTTLAPASQTARKNLVGYHLVQQGSDLGPKGKDDTREFRVVSKELMPASDSPVHEYRILFRFEPSGPGSAAGAVTVLFTDEGGMNNATPEHVKIGLISELFERSRQAGIKNIFVSRDYAGEIDPNELGLFGHVAKTEPEIIFNPDGDNYNNYGIDKKTAYSARDDEPSARKFVPVEKLFNEEPATAESLYSPTAKKNLPAGATMEFGPLNEPYGADRSYGTWENGVKEKGASAHKIYVRDSEGNVIAEANVIADTSHVFTKRPKYLDNKIQRKAPKLEEGWAMTVEMIAGESARAQVAIAAEAVERAKMAGATMVIVPFKGWEHREAVGQLIAKLEDTEEVKIDDEIDALNVVFKQNTPDYASEEDGDAAYGIRRDQVYSARDDEPAQAPLSVEQRKARIEEIKREILPLASKGNLSREEGARYSKLGMELETHRFEMRAGRGLKLELIKPMQERGSAIPSEIVKIASDELASNRAAFDALTEASLGVRVNQDTAVDVIMNGENANVSPSDLYSAFDRTREALRRQFGDTIVLYRAHGKQKQKATQNWHSTEAGARDYGSNIERREIPVDDVIAMNVGLRGAYEEFVIGKKPGSVDQDTALSARDEETAGPKFTTPSGELANHGDQDLADRGFITNEATKMPADLAGVKLVIKQDQVNGDYSYYKGELRLGGRKIAEFNYNTNAEYDDVPLALDWIEVQKKHRGKDLSKVIQAEIIERAKRAENPSSTYYSTVVDPKQRPIRGMQSLLGKENVSVTEEVFDQTDGRDQFRVPMGDGTFIKERREVEAKIPNQYTPEQRQLIKDMEAARAAGNMAEAGRLKARFDKSVKDSGTQILSARDEDGENTVIPGGKREEFLKKKPAARPQYYTEIGHDPANAENSYLFMVDSDGVMYVKRVSDLKAQITENYTLNEETGVYDVPGKTYGMDVNYLTHSDWEDVDNQFENGIIRQGSRDAIAFGRIEVKDGKPYIAVGGQGDVGSEIALNDGRREFRSIIRDAAQSAIDSGEISNVTQRSVGLDYSFVDGGDSGKPAVFSARDEESAPALPEVSTKKGGLIAAVAAVTPTAAEAASRSGAALSAVTNMDLVSAAAAIGLAGNDRLLSGLNPIVANMHLLARDTKSPTIRSVAEMFNRLGGNVAAGAQETYFEERDGNRRIFRNKLVDAFKPLAGLSEADLKAMDQDIAMALAGEKTLTGPEGQVVANLQALSDEIFDYLSSAGVKVNYAKDYGMPHSFNTEQVLTNEQAFLADAARAYQVNNPMRIKRLTDYIQQIQNQAAVRGGMTAEMTERVAELNKEINELQNAKPAEQAQALLEAIDTSNAGGDSTQGLLLEGRGTGQNKADFTRERIFEPAARRILRDYFNNDPRHAWNSYIARATTLAEFARRFGGDGSKWTDMVRQMRTENVSNKDITRIKNMVLDSLGVLNTAPTEGHALAVSILGLSNMAKLKTTALTNFLEAQAQAIPGHLGHTVTAPINMLGQFMAIVTELSPRQQAQLKNLIGLELSTETGAMELARAVGLIDAAGLHEIMENSAFNLERSSDFAGATKTDKAARKISNATGALARAYGIEASENAKRAMATKYAANRLDAHVSEFLRDGLFARAWDKLNQNNPNPPANPFTLRNEAVMRLRRAGVSDSQMQAFAQWWETARAGDFNAAIKGNDPMAKLARKVIRMETARASVNTNRAMKPGGKENPLVSQDTFAGKAMMSFLNYPATFAQQIGKPMIRDIKTAARGYETEGGNSTFYSGFERARMGARALAIPAMAVSAAVFLALRAWASGHEDDVKEKPIWKHLLEGLTYTGIAGGKSEFASRVSRGQLPPVFDEGNRLIRDLNRNDDKKNGKERAVTEGAIRGVGVPAALGASSTFLPVPLAAVVNQAMASKTFREMATDFIAGPAAPKKQNQAGTREGGTSQKREGGSRPGSR